ncbi:hypothetical protein DKX38_000252 [Salix brachista]|uniref:Uncharacterized protein n=1 Tax=Salix brachista TaxID=2182728 RepID=A0A5N5P1S3_9ROSI|nr:hypothetical protein DKX38_000252 [Salix brachista]
MNYLKGITNDQVVAGAIMAQLAAAGFVIGDVLRAVGVAGGLSGSGVANVDTITRKVYGKEGLGFWSN